MGTTMLLVHLWLAGAPGGEVACAPSAASFVDGHYEGLSPLTGQPYGPISPERARELLPQWLRVTRDGDSARVVVMPEERETWTLSYGPDGLVEKEVRVDGELWTASRFAYDSDGRLVSKRVEPLGLRLGYETDRRGRITKRTPVAGGGPGYRVSHSAKGATRVFDPVGRYAPIVRVDRWDRQGRLVGLAFGPRADAPTVELRLVRDARGKLLRVRRRFSERPGAKWRPAKLDAPDEEIRGREVGILGSEASRAEAWLLFGPPRKRSDDGQGRERTLKDDWSGDACWLDQTNQLEFDAAGHFTRGRTHCICGFCVAVEAPLALEGLEVLGTDHHYAPGPWVRLRTASGAVEVTADHRVMTPAGPRAAGELRAGDEVRGAEGTLVVEAVEALEARTRLGVNVRTREGVFVAAGIVFESEQARECGP